jgi:alanyl-tRNA synthetase
MNDASSRIAHTAEHAFIGALQKILGQTLRVRKVEHKKDGINTAFILIPTLEIDTVVRAELMVNTLIAEGRQVLVRNYSSLDEAKRDNVGLRANEERITGNVRVIEIEGHDVTACSMEHAPNLKECEFFLATRVSKTGNEYEVDFVVGEKAREAAIALSAKLMNVCKELGANIHSLEATVKKMHSESISDSKKLKALSRKQLESVVPVMVSNVKIFKGVFSDLADDALTDFAGEKITTTGSVVVIANLGSMGAHLVFARHEGMTKINCNYVFRKTVGVYGKGGGKPHFVTGVIAREKAEEIVESLSSEAVAVLGQN